MDHADSLGHGLELILHIHDGELVNMDLGSLAYIGNHIGISHEGNLHKAHVAGQGSGLDGVGIHAPGGNHALADALCLEFGKQIVKIGNHGLFLVF